ncbi:hypothetical protein [Burkholderia cepacia]|uniref:hypothetical protein n=1 Tax=Burkholderia cepacia TaxID=292 RepID=UPI00163984E4|nr:hypothetical protein [Burkholderia cepacia]
MHNEEERLHVSAMVPDRPQINAGYSEHYQYVKQGSDTLFVWFGGINEPFFSSSFPGRSGYDCLYFRDSNSDWYANGVFGLTQDSSAFISIMRNVIMPNYRCVCFGGQSSGGYAALFYGLACLVDLCIVFSPQIRNQFDGQCRMSPHVRIHDLHELYRNSTERPRAIVNVSRSEREHQNDFQWNDIKQLDDFRHLDKVTLNIHPYDNHAVSVKLREEGLLYDLLVGYVTGYGATVKTRKADAVAVG